MELYCPTGKIHRSEQYIHELKQQIRLYKGLLGEAEIYVRAYVHDRYTPEGISGASALLKRIDAALD